MKLVLKFIEDNRKYSTKIGAGSMGFEKGSYAFMKLMVGVQKQRKKMCFY